MRQKVKQFICAMLIVSMIFSLVSCSTSEIVTGTNEAPETTTSQFTDTTPDTGFGETVPTTTEEVAEPEPTLPEFMNPLTGLACDESLVGKRPVMIVYNNLKVSLPQSGLSKCDIIYEVLAEGGILRIAGISLDYANLGTLGSLRSARPYLVELSTAYDALFLHAGGTERAYEAIDRLGIDDVDGVHRGPFWANGAGVFWRDQDRLNAGVPREHTLFSNGTYFVNAIQYKGYRLDLTDSNFTAFEFTPKNEDLSNGSVASYIKIPHSSYSVSEFYYNEEDGLYYHNQFGEKHIDGENNQQIATENVMILFTQQSLYPGQTVTAYRKIDIVGEGKGYYAYGGMQIPIVWKRASETGTFSYFLEDGVTPLSVRCGKSYIAIADQAIQNEILFS